MGLLNWSFDWNYIGSDCLYLPLTMQLNKDIGISESKQQCRDNRTVVLIRRFLTISAHLHPHGLGLLRERLERSGLPLHVSNHLQR